MSPPTRRWLAGAAVPAALVSSLAAAAALWPHPTTGLLAAAATGAAQPVTATELMPADPVEGLEMTLVQMVRRLSSVETSLERDVARRAEYRPDAFHEPEVEQLERSISAKRHEVEALHQDIVETRARIAAARAVRDEGAEVQRRSLERSIERARAEQAELSQRYAEHLAQRRDLVTRSRSGVTGVAMHGAAVTEHRTRLQALEVEAAVSDATIDFLTERLDQLAQRLEQRIADDEILSLLRRQVASHRLLLEEAGRVSDADLLDTLERRAAHESALARRLGLDRLLDLESRVLDAELRATQIAVERSALEARLDLLLSDAEVVEALDMSARLLGPEIEAQMQAEAARVRELESRRQDLEISAESARRLREIQAEARARAAGGPAKGTPPRDR